jgi:hypothetical protein
MTAVLLTGSRAPVTLDLARRFADEGMFVVVADSQPAVTSSSKAVGAAYRVPSARFRPWEFAAAVDGIAERHAVDLVVPTCEEIFWLAGVAGARLGAGAGAGAGGGVGSAPRIGSSAALFSPPIEMLRRLHDKGEFVALLGSLGLPHPATEVISSRISWRRREAARKRHPDAALVVKPAFSRFGTRTLFVEPGEGLPRLPRVSRDERWLVQERLEGEEFCSYAVAVDGRLTAFVTYRPAWRAGRGAGVAFERVDPASAPARAAREIVEAIASHLGLTGQFGLDLMSTPSGVRVLECNPRATSGVHLFAPQDGLGGAFFGETAEAPRLPAVRLALPHTMYALAGMKGAGGAGRWFRQLRHPDALRPPADRVPVSALVRSVVVQLRTAQQAGVPLLAASTHDIEWNGETVPPAPAGMPAARAVGERRSPAPLRPVSADAVAAVSSVGDLDASVLRPRRSDWAATFAAGIRTAGGTRSLADNIDVTVSTVDVEGNLLPMTLPREPPAVHNHQGPAPDAADAPSYVVSPSSHYLRYAREELGELDSRAARVVAGAVLTVLSRLVEPGRLDEVVIVGNGLLSTNLLPDVGEAEVARVTAELRASHPRTAIAWRGVHGRNSRLPESLRRCGYRLIPSRSVLFTPTRDSEWATLRDTRRDAELLSSSDYRVRRLIPDAATGMSDAPTRRRVAELYGQLYLHKYSFLNPRYTAEFIGVAQSAGLLDFFVLERNGRIDGVMGCTVAHGLLAAPVVGYDTGLPQETGLYRMLSYLIALTAQRSGVDLHNSSGVADFKRNRGGEPELEYTAVFTRHLPWPRRAAWALLATAVERVGVPLVERNAL